MNRSMCLDNCSFLYRLPGEDFLKDFIRKSRATEPLIEKPVILRKHKDTKTDLAVHFDATLTWKIYLRRYLVRIEASFIFFSSLDIIWGNF